MDAATDNCPWHIRDLLGWREGVLFAASAELLVAWHAASLSPQRAASPGQHRLHGLVEDVRRARLAGDVDRLEAACRSLVDLTDRSRLPTSSLQAALAELRRSLTSIDPSQAPICLAHGATCAHPAPSDHPGRQAADAG